MCNISARSVQKAALEAYHANDISIAAQIRAEIKQAVGIALRSDAYESAALLRSMLNTR